MKSQSKFILFHLKTSPGKWRPSCHGLNVSKPSRPGNIAIFHMHILHMHINTICLFSEFLDNLNVCIHSYKYQLINQTCQDVNHIFDSLKTSQYTLLKIIKWGVFVDNSFNRRRINSYCRTNTKPQILFLGTLTVTVYICEINDSTEFIISTDGIRSNRWLWLIAVVWLCKIICIATETDGDRIISINGNMFVITHSRLIEQR